MGRRTTSASALSGQRMGTEVLAKAWPARAAALNDM